MDWDAFRDWCLADYRKARATVSYTMGRLRAMQRFGLDIDRFLSSPPAARDEARRLVANLKLSQKGAHMVRTFQKVLNWLLDYARHLQPDLIWGERFELEPEPKSMLVTVPEARVPEMWCYIARNQDAERTRLRRALAWVAYWTRMRRSEIHRLEDQDATPAGVFSRNPAKRGIPNERIVPDFFFHRHLPLGDYLVHRPKLEGSTKLWIRRHLRTGDPVECTAAAVYNEIAAMGRDLGMRIHFIATRRAGSTMLDEHNVHPRVGASQNGQNAVASWERYVGQVTPDRARREFARAGVPGFERLQNVGQERHQDGAERYRADHPQKLSPGDGRHVLPASYLGSISAGGAFGPGRDAGVKCQPAGGGGNVVSEAMKRRSNPPHPDDQEQRQKGEHNERDQDAHRARAEQDLPHRSHGVSNSEGHLRAAAFLRDGQTYMAPPFVSQLAAAQPATTGPDGKDGIATTVPPASLPYIELEDAYMQPDMQDPSSISTTPSAAWRPRAAATTATPGLGDARGANADMQAAKAFTRGRLVAPDGASGPRVVPPTRLTRPATPAEILRRAHGVGG